MRFRRWIEVKYRKRNEQLDAEIRNCLVKYGPQSQRRLTLMIKAPPATIIRHLKKAVILGELDTSEGPRSAIIYRLPRMQ